MFFDFEFSETAIRHILPVKAAMAPPTSPMRGMSLPGVGRSIDNHCNDEPLIKPEEIVSLYLHPQFQPMSLYPKEMVFPSSSHVACWRSEESPRQNKSPSHLQENYSIHQPTAPASELPEQPANWSLPPHPSDLSLDKYPVALPLPIANTLHGHVTNPQHPPKIGFLPHFPARPTSHVTASLYPCENKGQTAGSIASKRRAENAPESGESKKGESKKAKVAIPYPLDGDRQKSKAVIDALNAASGGKNDRAAALAAEHMRGIIKCKRKWVSCTEIHIFVRSLLNLYKQVARFCYARKQRKIGSFESREKAAFAYEIVRENLKSDTLQLQQPLDLEAAEAAFKSARDAALEVVGMQGTVSNAVIDALNAASGGKNNRAAALAAEHMRGTLKRPSGKWVSCELQH
jgi:hypothetical protein